MHLFYDRGDLGEIDRRRARALGIDIKAHDGYVILPPSIHPDSRKPYRWDEPLRPIAPLPDGLRRLLTPQPPTSPTHTTTPTVGKLAGLLRTVAEAKVNNRNNLLYWAGCRAAEACYGQGVWDALAEAARATGLSDREIWNAIRSAQSTGGAAA
jgi:hypothetical protein